MKMHDCLDIQEKLFDLVMNEIEFSEQSQILAEVSFCTACQIELEALEKTLLLYEQTVLSNEPTIAEWQDFEENLCSHLTAQTISAKPFRQRLLAFSIRIPAPALAAFILLAGAVALTAFRPVKFHSPQHSVEIGSTSAEYSASSSLPTQTSPPEKIIVREERVITRNVYLTKRANRARQSLPAQMPKNPPETEHSALNLAEFKLIRPVTPSVLKGEAPQ